MTTFNEKNRMIGTAEYNTNFWNVMRGDRLQPGREPPHRDRLPQHSHTHRDECCQGDLVAVIGNRVLLAPEPGKGLEDGALDGQPADAGVEHADRRGTRNHLVALQFAAHWWPLAAVDSQHS